jgi:hypothetical protein
VTMNDHTQTLSASTHRGHNTLPQTHADADARGAAWANAWNTRDIDAVLAHFDENVTFRSSIAADLMGHGTINGKSELRAYWVKALAGISSLHFTVERVLWDAELRELAVMYVAGLGDKRRHACERMRLDERGVVVEADALYGAPVEALG